MDHGLKFALVGLETHVSNGLTREAGENFSIGPESEIDLGDHWKEWLGSIRAKDYKESNIFVQALAPTSRPGILDQENYDLEQVINAGFTGLLLSRNFIAFSSPMFLSGAKVVGKASVRRIATWPRPVHEQAARSSELAQSDLAYAVCIGQQLLRSREKKLWRINRGIALYRAARCEPDPLERFHQYVRVLEAATKPPNKGGTTQNFCIRMTMLATEPEEGLFRRLYETRGAIEHLREHELLHDSSRQARLRLVKDEYIAEYLSRTILARLMCQENLWRYFGTAERLDQFWANCPEQQSQIWGQRIDTVRALDGFDPSMLSDQDLGLA